MEFSFTNNADIAELIHRGGIFMDVEGTTPEEIYKRFGAFVIITIVHKTVL